jgi:hypothetical protein
VCLKADEHRTRSIFPEATVVPIEYASGGTACSEVLAAMPYLDPDDSVLIATPDQFVDWDPEAMYTAANKHAANGVLLSFKATEGSPNGSYIRPCGPYVYCVASGMAASTIGVAGVYWYRSPEIMRNAMIEADTEGALCLSFNHVDGNVIHVPCTTMEGVGTPEDLDAYQRRHAQCCFGKCTHYGHTRC